MNAISFKCSALLSQERVFLAFSSSKSAANNLLPSRYWQSRIFNFYLGLIFIISSYNEFVWFQSGRFVHTRYAILQCLPHIQAVEHCINIVSFFLLFVDAVIQSLMKVFYASYRPESFGEMLKHVELQGSNSKWMVFWEYFADKGFKVFYCLWQQLEHTFHPCCSSSFSIYQAQKVFEGRSEYCCDRVKRKTSHSTGYCSNERLDKNVLLRNLKFRAFLLLFYRYQASAFASGLTFE